MKIGKIALAATLALGAAVAVPQLANAQAYDYANGVNFIGVDITGAGYTYSSVQAYLDRLAPETRRSTLSACNTVSNWPNQYPLNVQNFCRLAVQ